MAAKPFVDGGRVTRPHHPSTAGYRLPNVLLGYVEHCITTTSYKWQMTRCTLYHDYVSLSGTYIIAIIEDYVAKIRQQKSYGPIEHYFLSSDILTCSKPDAKHTYKVMIEQLFQPARNKESDEIPYDQIMLVFILTSELITKAFRRKKFLQVRHIYDSALESLYDNIPSLRTNSEEILMALVSSYSELLSDERSCDLDFKKKIKWRKLQKRGTANEPWFEIDPRVKVKPVPLLIEADVVFSHVLARLENAGAHAEVKQFKNLHKTEFRDCRNSDLSVFMLDYGERISSSMEYKKVIGLFHFFPNNPAAIQSDFRKCLWQNFIPNILASTIPDDRIMTVMEFTADVVYLVGVKGGFRSEAYSVILEAIQILANCKERNPTLRYCWENWASKRRRDLLHPIRALDLYEGQHVMSNEDVLHSFVVNRMDSITWPSRYSKYLKRRPLKTDLSNTVPGIKINLSGNYIKETPDYQKLYEEMQTKLQKSNLLDFPLMIVKTIPSPNDVINIERRILSAALLVSDAINFHIAAGDISKAMTAFNNGLNIFNVNRAFIEGRWSRIKLMQDVRNLEPDPQSDSDTDNSNSKRSKEEIAAEFKKAGLEIPPLLPFSDVDENIESPTKRSQSKKPSHSTDDIPPIELPMETATEASPERPQSPEIVDIDRLEDLFPFILDTGDGSSSVSKVAPELPSIVQDKPSHPSKPLSTRKPEQDMPAFNLIEASPKEAFVSATLAETESDNLPIDASPIKPSVKEITEKKRELSEPVIGSPPKLPSTAQDKISHPPKSPTIQKTTLDMKVSDTTDNISEESDMSAIIGETEIDHFSWMDVSSDESKPSEETNKGRHKLQDFVDNLSRRIIDPNFTMLTMSKLHSTKTYALETSNVKPGAQDNIFDPERDIDWGRLLEEANEGVL